MAGTHCQVFVGQNTCNAHLTLPRVVSLVSASNGCSSAPIGIFDSGIGGLSVLRHMQLALPQEHFIYFADAGFAPYGDKSPAAISARSLAIAQFLQSKSIKALVVACNSATAAAVDTIRANYPALVVIGIEPGLKPAAQQTRTGVVGVLATAATLSSDRFNSLRVQIETESKNVRFIARACVGLADQIEKGELRSNATIQLLERHITPLLSEGADTLVLGCTHYPFVRPAIESLINKNDSVLIIDTSEAVTRQLVRRLEHSNLLCEDKGAPIFQVFTTGSKTVIEKAFKRLLGQSVSAQCLNTT